MQYDTDERPAARIVRFAGDIGSSDEHELKTLFVRLKEDAAVQAVFDMGKVGFLDSTALGTLVWGLKNLREAGGDLRLCGLTGFVRRLFEMTGLDKAFQVFEDCEQAVQSFAG
jgi:anti-sigma B factor antagonist